MANTKRRRRQRRLNLRTLMYLIVLLGGTGVLLGLAVITHDPATVKTAVTIVVLAGGELVRQAVLDHRRKRQ